MVLTTKPNNTTLENKLERFRVNLLEKNLSAAEYLYQSVKGLHLQIKGNKSILKEKKKRKISLTISSIQKVIYVKYLQHDLNNYKEISLLHIKIIAKVQLDSITTCNRTSNGAYNSNMPSSETTII